MNYARTWYVPVLVATALAATLAHPAGAQSLADAGQTGSRSTELARSATARVTHDFEGATIEQALTALSAQTGTRIMFGEDVYASSKRVSVRLHEAGLMDALSAVLRGTGLVAVPAPDGESVIVRAGKAQQRRAVAADTVKGRVVEVGGAPVATAEVVVEGTSQRAVTNEEGRFVVTGLQPGTYTVAVRKIGYSTVKQSVTVGAGEAPSLLFQMTLQPFVLNELVVTGVSEATSGAKLPFTVGKLSQEAVTSVPPAAGNALGTLAGKVAGVTILNGSGAPGDPVEILLRTPTSIQNTISNAPMIVVDGVILSSTYTSGNIDIDALDIESIEVVKGAAAAALYGSRAASGVIQIRTRRGSGLPEGETRITARSEMGISSVSTDYPLARSHFYVTNEQGQFLDRDGNVTEDPSRRVIESDRILDNAYGVPLYDNVKALFQPGRFMTNSVTMSQNDRKTNFLVTASQSDNEGSLANNDGSQTYSLRLNLDHRVSDAFSLGVTGMHSRMSVDNLYSSPFATLLEYSPEVDLSQKDSTGQYVRLPSSYVSTENPLWYQGSRESMDKRSRTMGGLQARYTPLSWLSFSGNVSYDRLDNAKEMYIPMGTPQGSGTSNGYLQNAHSVVEALNASGTASLTGQLGGLATRLNLTALTERERNDFFNAIGRDFLMPDVKKLSVAQDEIISSSMQEVRANGYYANANLDYDGKYIADLLVRRDGSSLFGADERWQTYFRTAGAYRISEEPWFEVPGINDLKLRYSIGTAGGRPTFAAQYETWYVWSGGIDKTAMGNRDLRPSRTTEQELGLDLVALDRYSLQLSYVKQKTEDQIISLTVPAVTGYSTRWTNAGTMEGNSLEATLEAVVMDRPGLRWTSTMIADRSSSEITDWQKACYVSLLQKFCEGSSMSDVWGQQFLTSAGQLPDAHAGSADQFQVNDDGYLVAVGAGNSYEDGLAKDLWGTKVNVDGVDYDWGMPILMTDASGSPLVSKIGQSRPDLNFGWMNNVRWNDFELFTHLHAQIGGQVYNRARQSLYRSRRHGDLDQAGKPDALKKPETYYSRLANGGYTITSSFLEDGSFLKLREVGLKYTLSGDDLARFGLGRLGTEQVKLGISGRNLFTATDYTGFDPEVGSILSRYDSAVYPNLRTFTGTVEITF